MLLLCMQILFVTQGRKESNDTSGIARAIKAHHGLSNLSIHQEIIGRVKVSSKDVGREIWAAVPKNT